MIIMVYALWLMMSFMLPLRFFTPQAPHQHLLKFSYCLLFFLFAHRALLCLSLVLVLAISSCSMTLFTLLWACNETLATTWSRRQRLWWQSCFRMLWSPPSYIWFNPFRKRKIETRMASLEQSRVYFRGRCRLYTCSTQMSGSDEAVLLLPAF